MKLTSIFLFIAGLQVHAAAFSQKVTVSGKNLSLEQVFSQFKSQTGYDILYNPALLKKSKPVTLSLKNADLKNALELCLKDQPVDFVIRHTTIVITPKTGNPQNIILAAPRPIPITGKVSSETGEPLFNANVTIKGTNKVVTTNENGIFIIDATPDDVLVITMVGYVPFEIKIGDQKNLNITL